MCVRVRAPRVRLRVWIIALSLSCHLPWPISGQVIKCCSKYITAYILCRATKMSLWNQYGQSPICVNQNKTAHFTGLKNTHVFLPFEHHLKGAACFFWSGYNSFKQKAGFIVLIKCEQLNKSTGFFFKMRDAFISHNSSLRPYFPAVPFYF